MPLLLEKTRVVLVAPSLPENVGSVARAMGHFGLKRLVIVEGVDPTHARARALAAGHDTVLEAASTAPDLEAAVAGCVLVVGTTARPQGTVDRRSVVPAEAASLAAAHAAAGEVALVFGCEKHGLSNAELRLSHQIVTIPGEPDACLNLAQAAAILAYAWREAALATADAPGLPVTALAAEEGLGDLAGRLADLLEGRGLIKARERESKRHTLRRILSRARLSVDEVRLVAGWLRALVSGVSG